MTFCSLSGGANRVSTDFQSTCGLESFEIMRSSGKAVNRHGHKTGVSLEDAFWTGLKESRRPAKAPPTWRKLGDLARLVNFLA